jgi:hypothetical protein
MESIVADLQLGTHSESCAQFRICSFAVVAIKTCILMRNMPTKQPRPIGVTILALIYLWIGCGGTLFFPIIALFGGMTLVWRQIAANVIHSGEALRVTSYLFSSILFLFYVAYATMGFGLWKLRNWARLTVLWINVFWVVVCCLCLPTFVKLSFFAIPLLIATLPPFGWIIWYLMRPRVRFAFGVLPSELEGKMNAQPRGLSRMGVAWIVLGAFSTFALFIISVFALVEGMMRATGAYSMAMTQAEDSPCVVQALGSPLTVEWMISGNTNENGDDGSANLSIPVHGPKGKGTLDLDARKLNGAWKIRSLVLNHDSDEIQIVPANAPCK